MKNNISLIDKINYKLWKHFNKKILNGNAIYNKKMYGEYYNFKDKTISIPYEKPSSTYKCLISNIGCGFSGSGTIIDFLREFDNTTVHGFFSPERIGDEEKVAKLRKLKTQTEVDFFSASGSLFELERLIESNNFLVKDSALKRFISLAEMQYYQYKGIYNDEFMRLTREFIDDLVDFKISSTDRNMNFSLRAHRHLIGESNEEIAKLLFSNNTEPNSINLERPFLIGEEGKVYNFYFLKKISVEEFREKAKNYLHKFLLTIDSKDFLVLDHFISTIESNYDIKSKYFNNLKCILVWRDPRDVYTQMKQKNMDWAIPTKNVDDFIKWYKIGTVNQLEGENVNFKNCLVIRFEDFVLKYDEVSKQIMDFLGLKEENHVDPKGYFKPEISCKTIGLVLSTISLN